MLIKVTRIHGQKERTEALFEARNPTLFWDVHPDCVVIKSVLVCIEALECILVSRVISIHGCVVLMPEDYARARHTFS